MSSGAPEVCFNFNRLPQFINFILFPREPASTGESEVDWILGHLRVRACFWANLRVDLSELSSITLTPGARGVSGYPVDRGTLLP